MKYKNLENIIESIENINEDRGMMKIEFKYSNIGVTLT